MTMMPAAVWDPLMMQKDLQHPRPTKDIVKADKAAKDFEAMFFSQFLLPPLLKGLQESLSGRNEEGSIYSSILCDALGHMMAESGGVGYARSVFDTVLKLQEGGSSHDHNVAPKQNDLSKLS